MKRGRFGDCPDGMLEKVKKTLTGKKKEPEGAVREGGRGKRSF